MTESCENCKFYFAPDKLCRRFPAQMLAWKNPKPKNPEDVIVLRTQFPMMFPEGWCGEFQLRLEKLQ